MKMLHITFQKVKGQTELFIKLQRNPSLANEASFHVGDPFYLLFFSCVLSSCSSNFKAANKDEQGKRKHVLILGKTLF